MAHVKMFRHVVYLSSSSTVLNEARCQVLWVR